MSALRPTKLVLIKDHDQRPEDRPGGLVSGTFEQALNASLDSLYRTAVILVGDDPAAEDLVQDAALRAYRGWKGLRSGASARAWFLRILHRTYLNSRRSQGRRPAFVDIDIEQLLDQSLLGAEGSFTGEALADDVAAALDALPAPLRETLWLIDVEELTLAEAADVLNIPLGTVASRVYRARRMFRDEIARFGRHRDGGG